MPYTLSEESDYSLPADILPANTYLKAIPFFQYRAAPVTHTSLSYNIDELLTTSTKRHLYEEMVGDRRDYFLYCPDCTKVLDRLASIGLCDQNLTLDGNKGWFWTRHCDAGNEESKAKAFMGLLRHIRNSIAHGRIALEDGFIILEDFNGKGNLTARIVVDPETFNEWAMIIERVCLKACI